MHLRASPHTTNPTAALLIQLWSSYGEYVSRRVFPPKVSAGGTLCKNETTSNTYLTSFHRYIEDSKRLHFNISKPEHPLALVWEEGHLDTSFRWESDVCASVETDDCFTFLLYSM